MARRLGRPDQGAIGVLVAIFIGAGVLTGMGAMVVDVGQLYQNRAELQSGADAGALAVAESCAKSTCVPTAAGNFANANTKSGVAGVSLVCGSGTLGVCPASSGTSYDCPASPAGGTNYVDVHTVSQTAGGSHLVPPAFARTLPGLGNYQGSAVYACAQAQWGTPANATTLGFTIPSCEWAKATKNGTSYAPGTSPSPSFDVRIQLDEQPVTTCSSTAEGDTTTDLNGNCTVSITNGLYSGYISDPRRGTSAAACAQALSTAQSSRTPVLIPVYTTVDTSGALCGSKGSEPYYLSCWVAPGNPCYKLLGYAAFVVTGYNFPDVSESYHSSDYLSPGNSCTGGFFCLNGYFTQAVISSTGVLQSVSSLSTSGPYLGATVIRLTG
jgi:Flp pilus assembly protein TadG